MQKAIDNFNKAAEAFKAATKALHPFVEKEMKNRKTVEELMDLVEMLPPSYLGTRRVYEQIYRIQDRKA